MNRQTCIIIVPIYKNEFDWDEYNSVKQLFKILPVNKYDIVAICPESLDLTYYKKNFEFLDYYYFWDSYFTNYPNGYNSLLLNLGFYELFNNYEYMLIYQPDCWVFRDELEYWCNKEYDYIGAPFFFRYPYYMTPKTHVGNGGFSLRKISKFIYICETFNDECENLGHLNDTEIGEDHIFLEILESGAIINFNLPSFLEAAQFSFEMDPHFLYQITENKLPFGCHAYKKIVHSWFWDDFICYGKKRYSIVTFLFGNYENLKDPLYVDESAEYICITDRTDLQSNVWKFENITEYDISNYNDWQKSMIARYTALNHINTDICFIVDASILIKKSLNKIIIDNYNSDFGIIIHPFRDSYLDEFNEWIEKRGIDEQQKNDFIDFCNKHNFDYINAKGFIMSTIMFIKKNEHTINMMNQVLTELMNNYKFSMRVDQLYLSVIFFKYYWFINRNYYSYQILNSQYFSYYYHDKNLTHKDDYKPNLLKPERRVVYGKKILCKYLT